MAFSNTNGPGPKYEDDPVMRDVFTALDVSMVLPLTFLVEGMQGQPQRARVAVATAALAVAAGFTTHIFSSSVETAVAVAAAVAAGGWAVQLALQFYDPPETRASDKIATWLATTMSAVHFVTLINLSHSELAKDRLIRWGRRVVFALHAVAGTILVIIVLVMDRLWEAWGCYPRGTALSEFKFGPCGQTDTPSRWPPNQAICRHVTPCDATGSAAQLAGRPLQISAHIEVVAFAIYTVLCFHAFTIYDVERAGVGRVRRGTGGSESTMLLLL